MSPEKSGKTSETHDIDEATQQDTLKEEKILVHKILQETI